MNKPIRYNQPLLQVGDKTTTCLVSTPTTGIYRYSGIHSTLWGFLWLSTEQKLSWYSCSSTFARPTLRIVNDNISNFIRTCTVGITMAQFISWQWNILSSPQWPNRFWGPPNLQFNGYLGLKEEEQKAEQSPSSSAKVKDGAAMPSLPRMSFRFFRGPNLMWPRATLDMVTGRDIEGSSWELNSVLPSY
jgi:hypothetical protein